MRFSLKHLSFSIIRLFLSIPIPLIAAFLFNYFNHRSYYSTIRNIQTVDFNILTNTLPTKLSLSLRDNDIKEVQRTINSNYGLFGIVITDCQQATEKCPGQQMIAVSQPEREGWGDKQFPDSLSGSLFDILRDPPPTTAEWGFYSPSSNTPISTGRENWGEIIGRVYYVRRDPPNFIENHQEWLLMPVNAVQNLTKTGNFRESASTLAGFVSRGANKYFFLTNLLGVSTGILFWIVWDKFSYKRKIEKDSYQQKEREFDAKSKAYEQELKISQNKVKCLESGLVAQKRVAEKLHQELDNAKAKVNREKQNLRDINERFERAQTASKSAKEENQLLFQQLADARIQTQEKWQVVASLQNQLDSTQQSSLIDQLQHELKHAIQEASKNQQNIEELIQKLKLSSQFLREKEDEYQALSEQFSVTHENLSTKENDIRNLQVSLEAVLTKENQYLERIDKLKDKTLKLEIENQQLESSRRNENIKHRKTFDESLKERDEFIDNIVEENDSLREEKDRVQSYLETIESENEVLKLRLIQIENLEVEDADSVPQNLLGYTSVTEALLDAQENHSILEIWDSAFKSASTMNHYLPDKVYESLKVLSQVGQMYFENTTCNNLAEIFRQAGFQYTPRESSSTVRLYGDDRLFHHRGKSKQMFRHLKLGKLRLYFELDKTTKKVQVGYCGKHLRIASG